MIARNKYTNYMISMLVELRIENFGIIEKLKFRPGKGLNIITGETGSGKSLIIQALGIVLGDRAGSGYLRNGANRATIEAVFDLSKNETKQREIRDFLAYYQVPFYDEHLIVKREIFLDGRPRSYINESQVSLHILKELGTRLVEIHGQHENQRLLDPSFHLDFVDVFGGLEELRNRVSQLYSRWIESKKKLKSVSLHEEEKKFRKEFLQFAIQEIEDLNPQENEYEELQKERSMIMNAGKLYEDFSYSYSVLQEEDYSVISTLQNIEKILEKHSTLFPEFQEYVRLLQDSIYNLETVIDWIREKKLSMNFSSERLEDIEERLEGYRRLFKKYAPNEKSIIKKKEEFQKELNSIEMSDEEKELLRSEIQAIEQELRDISEELSLRRKQIIPILEEKIAMELEQLGMKGARIQISLSKELEREDENSSREKFRLHSKGYDQIEFLFCANEGEILLPLRKVASGGELSRIALALKSLILDKNGPLCVIFDEVDTGVGGHVGFVLGKKLKELSVKEQVIAITHLHQIASMAHRHFRILKITKNSRTYTKIERLMGENRLQELARMLGGDEPIVYEHAKEILFKAQKKDSLKTKVS